MRRLRRKDFSALASTGLFLASAGLFLAIETTSSRAAVIEETVNFSAMTPVPASDVFKTLHFSLFDPTLGTLTGATLGFSAASQLNVQLSPQNSGSFTVEVTDQFGIDNVRITDDQFFTGSVMAGDPLARQTGGELLVGGPASFAPSQLAGLTGVGQFELLFEMDPPSATVQVGPAGLEAIPGADVIVTATIDFTYSPAVRTVPEPGSMALLAVGLVGLGGTARRRAVRAAGASQAGRRRRSS